MLVIYVLFSNLELHERGEEKRGGIGVQSHACNACNACVWMDGWQHGCQDLYNRTRKNKILE